MTDEMLTAHFAYIEIFDPATILDRHERWLAHRLCTDHLEPIRAIVECPVYVSSGHRTKQGNDRLELEGYDPNPVSDHSFGSDWNPLGVGAADILKIVDGKIVAFTEEDFEHIKAVRLEDESSPPWGQLIWYRHRGHLHVANHRRVLYSARAIDELPFWEYHDVTYVKE